MQTQTPAQGRLFSRDERVEQAPTIRERTNTARDRALQRVAQTAEDRHPGFGPRAAAVIVAHLEQHGPTPGERLTEACKAAGIVPDDDRAFGPVYMGLVRRGQIEKVGTVRRERGHGTAGGNVWAIRGAR